MYSIYFDWSPSPSGKRLWHPLNLPWITEAEAKAAAQILKTAFPKRGWAWGPTDVEGIKEVKGEIKVTTFNDTATDINTAGLTVEAIRARRHLGTFRNSCIGTVVEVYSDDDANFVLVISTAFDGRSRLTSREARRHFQVRIDENDWSDLFDFLRNKK